MFVLTKKKFEKECKENEIVYTYKKKKKENEIVYALMAKECIDSTLLSP